MVVCHLKRGALAFCGSIFLFYVFNRITLSLQHEDNVDKNKHLKRQHSFDNPGKEPKHRFDAEKMPDSLVDRPWVALQFGFRMIIPDSHKLGIISLDV